MVQSVAKAQVAIDLSKEQFKVDQRPYVWLTDPPPNPPMGIISKTKEGKLIWNIFYKNYGKSPAINLCARAYVITGKNTTARVIDIEHSVCSSKNGSILPPTHSEWFSGTYNGEATDSEFENWKAIEFGILVYGRIDYSDSSGVPYFSQFCLALQSNNAIADCTEHNHIH
jgi:hypothetical protein